MVTAKGPDDYKLKLSGAGLSIDRSVDETIARQIVALVMGGTVEIEQSSLKHDVQGMADVAADRSTPKAFMTDKRPKTDIERVTCLAYYLTHQRKTAAFKTNDLTLLNTEAAQQKLSNPSATARNAVAEGYLSLAGGGRKQITARGEALVSALPNRDKIQSALESHPIRKPRKKRQARKAK